MRVYPLASGGQVIDLDDGKVVPDVVWLDPDRRPMVLERRVSATAFKLYAGRFRYEPGSRRPVSAPALGAARCARCSSALTLPGDELCPACKARDRGQRHPMRVERLASPLLDRPCEHKPCGRLAVYAVSDEVVCSPQEQVRAGPVLAFGRPLPRRLLFDRAACVGRHYFCERHYSPPRVLDAKGEVVETWDEAAGVRPQW